MNKNRIQKTVLFLIVPFLFLACNFPLIKPVSTATQVPTVTPYLMPRLPLIQKSIVAPPSPTAAPAVDDFFARCPTAAELDSIAKDLSFNFEADPTAGKPVCTAAAGSADLTALQKRAYQSVLVMKQLAFDAPLPWTDKTLYDWFAGVIQGIRFRNNIQYSFCCEPANVIDIAVASNSYLMLTDRWADPSIGGGLMDTTVLYVHEARHNEGFPHTCPNGADDKTVAEMGAWGVQYSLLLWLAQHGDRAFLRAPGADPNAHRQLALDDALTIQRSRFCNEPTATPGAGPTLAP